MSTKEATAKAMSKYNNDALKWAAVKARDPAADGVFYYSVSTTGVYCNPSCPSREAKRRNVQFHASTAAAENAGFRACRRCMPDQPPLAQRQVKTIEAACRAIESAESPPSLKALAEAAGLSPHHFHRVFKRITSLTPKAYADAKRTEKVRNALSGTLSDTLNDAGTRITDAIYAAGYNSSGRFYATADSALGMRGTARRRGGDGETIRFAVGECSLGSVLVGMTAKGVCAIILADTAEGALHAFEDQFPNATLIPGDPEFDHHIAKTIRFIDTPNQELGLPLDIRGTVFQKRVWDALTHIPSGETRTYSEIAASLGAPKAARAVASACAANRLAIAIPCHRIIRRDGSLSGYRWGIERKRRLLEREEKQGSGEPSKRAPDKS